MPSLWRTGLGTEGALFCRGSGVASHVAEPATPVATVEQSQTLTVGRIFRFWAPLAATWLMMSIEGPFLAAVIARLGQAKFNLAAFGVAFSFAMLNEAPIIMMMSASVALVSDRQSFLALRRFAYTLNGVITLVMGVVLVPPVFGFLAERLIGLPHEVAALTHVATAILVPWPAAIGYRRFYQGILIRASLTRRVAYGTVVRVLAMAVTAIALYATTSIPGAFVGAAALSAGVTAEAVASRFMARASVRRLLADAEPRSAVGPLTTPAIVSLYAPLALTSLLTLGVNPLVTFFLGRGRAALDSLAIWPVVASMVFVFRSGGVAYQEVGIALLGDDRHGFAALRRFAGLLAVGTAGALAVVAFSPLASWWLSVVSGLSRELSRFAVTPLRVLAIMPALEVLLSFQRSLLVHARQTARITWATAVEVSGIIAVLALGVAAFDAVGAVAAAVALLVGRVAANVLLSRHAPGPISVRASREAAEA
jgi:progressive ankylosis protein